MIQVTPVILCGGSGTRLWPLSRTGFPKQFLCLTGNESLFQKAAQRLAALGSEHIQVAAPDISQACQAAWASKKQDAQFIRPTEVKTLLGDPIKAKQKLGWVPEITVQEMCAEIVAYDLVQGKNHGFQVNVSRE
jgi:GDP-D-mannose dehydratase